MIGPMATTDATDPIIVCGDAQGRVDPRRPDGGLRPAVGVHNIQVFRASRGKPDAADGDGWTYAHHPDLACWKGHSTRPGP